MIEVQVNSGICGFRTVIRADSEDMQNASLEIETDCPNLKPLTAELKTADSFKECFAKIGESGVYKLAAKYCKHPACPVPCGIIKGIEAACGLALPKDAAIQIKPVS
ncbi:Hypothetical protein LUCI_2874 [Lucifera butyrica]|uniref:Uncharacterized protein n=1 Tax=Lucifera butyrica TaxID=1351585 RepID=A0A498R8T9_9FIRM|nr:hypothetical protein [Lucifera butyrica]VBB07609.1 Hypothetical protein LUCI_2874 [Lucifera butyrica]